jgi:hypothetical protein
VGESLACEVVIEVLGLRAQVMLQNVGDVPVFGRAAAGSLVEFVAEVNLRRSDSLNAKEACLGLAPHARPLEPQRRPR